MSARHPALGLELTSLTMDSCTRCGSKLTRLADDQLIRSQTKREKKKGGGEGERVSRWGMDYY